MARGLKAIACIKAARGMTAFGFGASLISLQSNHAEFIWNKYPATLELTTSAKILIDWIDQFKNEELIALSLLAFGLGMLRWIEAAGIWYNKNWAEWLAVSTGAIYIPFEVNQLFRNFSSFVLIIFIVNLIVVSYLLVVLKIKRHQVKNLP